MANNHHIASRVAGSIVGGILGTLTAVIVFNPMAIFWVINKGFFTKPSRLFNPFYLLLYAILAPLILGIMVPLTPFTGLYLGITSGWKHGFVNAFTKAPLKTFDKVIYEGKKKKIQRGESPQPRLTLSDILFSILSCGFVTFAVLSVIFPAIFGITVLISTITYLGLSGLSTGLLAFLVGLGSSISACLLYALAPSLIGGLLGGVIAFLVFNPIACIINAAKEFWQEKNLLNFITILVSPLACFSVILISTLIGFFCGLNGGLLGTLFTPIAIINEAFSSIGKNGKKKVPLTVTDILISLLILGLVTLVSLMVIFPASFGLVTLLPAAITALGLSGLSTWALAIVAVTITFIVSSLAYCLFSNISTCHENQNTTALDGSNHHDKKIDNSHGKVSQLMGVHSSTSDIIEVQEAADSNTFPGHHTTKSVLSTARTSRQPLSGIIESSSLNLSHN